MKNRRLLRLIPLLSLLISTSVIANDYHCMGIGSQTSKLWQGREFIYRFLDAVDLKLIDRKSGEVIPLHLDRVYTTGNRYQAQGIHFFLTAGLISAFNPIDRAKINMSVYDQSGQLVDFSRLDCVLIYR